MQPSIPACLFTLLTVFAMLFQLALVLGAPWGELSMGGRFPGRLPVKLRIAAVIQMVILLALAVIVLTRAGLMLDGLFDLANLLIWLVVAFAAISAVLNAITPSRKERRLWLPVAILLLVCSLLVAIS